MNGLGFKEASEKEKCEFKQLHHPLVVRAFSLCFAAFIAAGLLGMFGIAIGIFSVSPGSGVFISRSTIECAISAKFISIVILLLIKSIYDYSFVRKFVWFTIFWICLHYCIGLPSLLGSDDGISSLELWSKQNLNHISTHSMIAFIWYIALFGVPFLNKKQ